MVPDEQVLRIGGQLPSEERQVPKVLAGLVAFIADVLENDVGQPDATPLVVGDAMNGRHHILVYDPFEPYPVVVTPQSVFPVGRTVEGGSEQQPERSV